MDLAAVLSSILAGIASSLLTVLILHVRQRMRDASLFGRLSGRYVHDSIEGERLLDGVTEVVHRRGNVLETHSSSSEGTWDGLIVMNRDMPSVGSGIYQYRERADCGTHQVQLSPDGRSFFVLAVNTSHGKSNMFGYSWRRDLDA